MSILELVNAGMKFKTKANIKIHQGANFSIKILLFIKTPKVRDQECCSNPKDNI